jgi:hypothetical protein
MMNHQNHGKWFIKPNGLKETVNVSPGPGRAGASLVAFQKYQIITAIGATMHPNSAVPSPTNTLLK